jgi:type II secretory pathway component PulC
MGRTFSAIANTGLFVLSCFFLAETANAVFEAILTPAAAAAIEPSAPAAPPIRGWQDRQVILTRNLFNASVLAPAAAPAAPVEEDLEATRLPLRLLGTAAATNPSYSWAAVEDTEARETEVVRVGSRLEKRKAEVIRIQRKRIVLLENGSHRELVIDDKTLPSAGSSGRQTAARSTRSARSARSARTSRASRSAARTSRTSRAARAAGRSSRSRGEAATNLANNMQQLGPNKFRVNPEDVAAAAADPDAAFPDTTVTPVFENGEITGFQVGEVPQGSVLAKVGLKSGDTVTELNDQRIDSLEAVEQFYSEVVRGDEIEIKLKDGRVYQFVYE